MTQDLVFAGNIVQTKILDHVIMSENRYFSFADGGLIEQYDANFLRLKEERKAQVIAKPSLLCGVQERLESCAVRYSVAYCYWVHIRSRIWQIHGELT